MGRTMGKAGLEKLNVKANKHFQLSECPKCNNPMKDGGYNYVDASLEKYYSCPDCNLFVLHGYNWVETEVSFLKEGLSKSRGL